MNLSNIPEQNTITSGDTNFFKTQDSEHMSKEPSHWQPAQFQTLPVDSRSIRNGGAKTSSSNLN